MSDNVSAVIN